MRSVLRSLNIFNNNSRGEIENKSVKNDIQIKNINWWNSLSKSIPKIKLKYILDLKVRFNISDMLQAKEIYKNITEEVAKPLVDKLSDIINEIIEEDGINFIDTNDRFKDFSKLSFEELWSKQVDYWYMIDDTWAAEFNFEDVPEDITNRYGIMLRLINRKKSDPLKESNPELFIMNGVWQSVMNRAENSEYIRNKPWYFRPRGDIYIDLNSKVNQLYNNCKLIFDENYLGHCKFDSFEIVDEYTNELDRYIKTLFYTFPSLEYDSRITSRLNLENCRKFF